MFLSNKYTAWYQLIVSRARLRVNKEPGDELHHVIPRSLGGSNDKSNKVILTAREHFVCHLLLRKMTVGRDKQRMSCAAWALARVRINRANVKVTSRLFEILRRELSASKKGIPRSAETKLKCSLAKLGKPLSDQHKAAIKAGSKPRTVSVEERHAISIRHKGKRCSDETKLKIGETSKGRKAGVKLWLLQRPDGSQFQIRDLEAFCIETFGTIMQRKALAKTLLTGTEISRGVAKGWRVLSKSRELSPNSKNVYC